MARTVPLRVRSGLHLDDFLLDLLWFLEKGYSPRFILAFYEGTEKGLFMKSNIPPILDRKAQHEKKRGRPMKYEDQREKAILLLLWGKKGWKRYSDLRHSGFSMESLFKFLRAKSEAQETDDV
jgi:hypothetical protein